MNCKVPSGKKKQRITGGTGIAAMPRDEICFPRSSHRTRRRAMRRKMGLCFIVTLVFMLATAWVGSALGEMGIPVTNDKVLNMCTDCHKNNRGMVSRISYIRQAPEACCLLYTSYA